MQVRDEILRRQHHAHAKAIGMEDILIETEYWATSMEGIMNRIPRIPIGITRFRDMPANQAKLAIDFLIDCWQRHHEFSQALILGRYFTTREENVHGENSRREGCLC